MSGRPRNPTTDALPASLAVGWPHFTAQELACRHCGRLHMHSGFMERLVALREEFGAPMPVTSGYRCPEHDAALRGAEVHPTGHAVDVRVSGADAHRLIALALRHGFTGIGVNQRGAHSQRFIHLDDLVDANHPRPTVWSY